ncbi:MULTISPECIES: YfcL family protein [unclassified Colwellia]|uniref:YfcL family protein n=1 Tax=unclassified Colwellia TaxID=196834 RepID=UPI0015F42529|nr:MULTISPECIES: YfcL family protein [unclassified Colwellia]MBA6231763.1 YfcL family protein [Colwellia sp. MB02u-7]MBA6235718.1 YfcL family protein [Colwellia sp. MB02u-11]MBA6298807.1 YfcL family protein [Colwellia sp. MB3u-22]MBA6309714.1 YfcL family protein [Colwellia sp. MB3u-64]
MSIKEKKSFENIAALYLYLDNLFDEDISDDQLFASSYLRGFISLSVIEFGDESQVLSPALATSIDEKLQAARTELSPQDRKIVQDYWLDLKQSFVSV